MMLTTRPNLFKTTVYPVRRTKTWIILCLVFVFVFICSILNRISDVTDYQQSDALMNNPDQNVRTDIRGFSSIKACREFHESKNKTRQWFWSPAYKNPCWEDELGDLKCVPYFFVLGFPKCGTTDLHNRMKLHPGFIPPLFKEIHWITRYRFYPFDRDDEGNRIILRNRDLHTGFLMYLRVFSPLSNHLVACKDPAYSSNLTEELFPVSSQSVTCEDKVTGDFSPSTIWDSDLYMQLPENNRTLLPVVTPRDFVYDMNPCAKFIVLLRNPVERLYSDYLHFYDEKSPEHFNEIVKTTAALYIHCFKKMGINPCLHRYTIERKGKARLRLGIYYKYIADWFEKFPRDQFLIIRLEDYAIDTRRYLTDIFHFLDLTVPSDRLMNEMASAQPTNTRQDRKEDVNAPPMLPETKKVLEEFYAPFNKKLAVLLNDKKYEW